MIIVNTQIKDVLRQANLGVESISKDFLPSLDEKVREMVVKAAERAKANSRRTVMARDI